MHVLATMSAVLAGMALLTLGVLSVWHDLTSRGPWDAPLVNDEDGLALPGRHRSANPVEHTDAEPFGSSSG